MGARRDGVADALVPLEPRPATRDELERVHPAAYLDAMERFCRGRRRPHRRRHRRPSPASWDAAVLAAGAGLAAVEALDRGEGDAAFCAVRPPGHHATPTRAMGFCLLNNVAVTAAHLAARGERVLIVDYDAHHGNGTQDIFYARPPRPVRLAPRVPAVPGHRRARPRRARRRRVAQPQLPVPEGTTGDVYLAAPSTTWSRRWSRRFEPTWLLVSAGFDAHRRDPITGLGLTLRRLRRRSPPGSCALVPRRPASWPSSRAATTSRRWPTPRPPPSARWPGVDVRPERADQRRARARRSVDGRPSRHRCGRAGPVDLLACVRPWSPNASPPCWPSCSRSPSASPPRPPALPRRRDRPRPAARAATSPATTTAPPTPARPRPSASWPAGPTRCGPRASASAPSAPSAATATFEITTHRAEAYDPDSRKPEVVYADVDRGRSVAARLHRQRHGPAARRPERARAHRPVRRGRRPRRQAAAHAAGARGQLQRRSAAHAAGGPLHRRLRARRPSPSWSDAVAAMRHRLEIVSAERIRDELDKLHHRRLARRRAVVLRRHRPGRGVPARAAGHAPRAGPDPPPQGRAGPHHRRGGERAARRPPRASTSA